MRDLPVLESDGRYAKWMTLIAYCYLLFPEDEQEAIRAIEVMVAEEEAMQSGLQSGYGEIGKLVSRLLAKRLQRARNSGLLFLQIILNAEKRGNPFVMRAEFAVAEFLAKVKSESGKPLAGSGNNIRKRSFPAFKSAVHYWAAFELLRASDKRNCFNEVDAFHRLMMTSAELLRRAVELDLESRVELLSNWDPWVMPQTYVELISEGRVSVIIPEEAAEISELIKDYSHKPFD